MVRHHVVSGGPLTECGVTGEQERMSGSLRYDGSTPPKASCPFQAGSQGECGVTERSYQQRCGVASHYPRPLVTSRCTRGEAFNARPIFFLDMSSNYELALTTDNVSFSELASRIRIGYGNEEPQFTPYLPRGERPEKTIWMPNQAMITVHAQLGDVLKRRVPLQLGPAYGGITGGSAAANIQPHLNSRYFYQLDLANAYGQVTVEPLVSAITNNSGATNEFEVVEQMLLSYCMAPDGRGLARGGPLSPYLFNIYCLHLDKMLQDFANGRGFNYTRYADDLTFSSQDKGFPPRDTITKLDRAAIRAIVKSQGLLINPRKTRVSDIHNGPVTIAGLQMDRNGQWHIRAQTAEKARKELLRQYGEFAHTLYEQQVRHLAAGYKGMLDAAEHGKEPSKSERRLRKLVTFILATIPA